jgi:hypothetical protein
MKINEKKTKVAKDIQRCLKEYDFSDKLDILIQVTVRMWMLGYTNDKDLLMDIISQCYDDVEDHANFLGDLKD